MILEVRFLKTYGKGCGEFIYLNYRTVASYIINYNENMTFDRVFFDEALMMHAGYLGYISILSKAKEIIIFGDSKQIPYIERSPITTRWHKISGLIDPYKYDDITQRCPTDTCYALSSHYSDIATGSKTVKSILPIGRSGDFFQIEADTLVLTYTQKEKAMIKNVLAKYENIKIFTIHEAQGLTARSVLLIRIDSSPKEIYNSIPHAIVALSRHTEKFK